VQIGIVGGGPGGLYLALLLKRDDPRRRVLVYEQNPAGATYGWGVVLSGAALALLRSADPDSWDDLAGHLETWGEQAIVHRGERVLVDGVPFSGVARLTLLEVLQEHCRRRGVDLRFESRVTDPADLGEMDLVVGADGVNSAVRERYREWLRPRSHSLTNRYAWYGTPRRFDCLTLTFRQTPAGAFVAHHYRYAAAMSTFIVECDAATWERAGLAAMSDEERRRHCEALFAEDLEGAPLLSTRSAWLAFRAISAERWSHGRVVLLGDALRTVHFSIGSGTRMALEDAIALAAALREAAGVPEALARYEAARRPDADKYLAVARESYAWYERFRDVLALDPLRFAHDYVTRSGRITADRLERRSPRFWAACAAAGLTGD
jgi:2-polyprenyl-6-methoxyphenol hydroxylase-like FAD-dependent oxidoreductase